MNITLYGLLAALLGSPAVLAEVAAKQTTSATATTTSAAPSCKASLITKLCNYPEPGSNFAVASDGKASCWEYCNSHQPCSFVIFAAGNPYTGTGTCWLYPSETFDATKGDSDCGNPYLSVYGKPVCSTSNPTSSGACAATATPSAIASVCGYPTPPDDCFNSCSASEGASDCLSQCAKADSCSYVVFNPHNSDSSPYAPGTCWIYPNGTYNPASTTHCKGHPNQFVYENKCPKHTQTTSSHVASTTSPPRSTDSASADADTTGDGENLAAARLPGGFQLAIGVAAFILQAL